MNGKITPTEKESKKVDDEEAKEKFCLSFKKMKKYTTLWWLMVEIIATFLPPQNKTWILKQLVITVIRGEEFNQQGLWNQKV